MRNVAEIEAVREELFDWAADKPDAIHGAARNLSGWLAVAALPSDPAMPEVDILACTARAVETLRAALKN